MFDLPCAKTAVIGLTACAPGRTHPAITVMGKFRPANFKEDPMTPNTTAARRASACGLIPLSRPGAR